MPKLKNIYLTAIITLILFGTFSSSVLADEAGPIFEPVPVSDDSVKAEYEPIGVGILDAVNQAGFENVSCPVGVANCVGDLEEADKFSTQGTQVIILRIIGGILNFAAILAVVMLVVAGVRLIVAMGNQEGLEAAKKHIIWTLAGLMLIILALVIVRNVTESVYDVTVTPEDPTPASTHTPISDPTPPISITPSVVPMTPPAPHPEPST